MQNRVWAFLLVLAMFAPTAAMADPTSFGVELAGTHGTHRERDGSATAPLVPAPVLTASHGFGCFELAAEGLPPVGPISFGNNGLGMKDITLTYADAVMRYWNSPHTIAVGIGDTLYNQRTDFLIATPIGARTIVDNSRVAGARYELTARKSFGIRDFLQARIGVDPAMHGRFTQSGYSTGPDPVNYTSPPLWEHASQVDADAGFTHAVGQYAVSYGVRYLNYSAAFDTWFGRPFADANSLVMPYVALVRTWDGPRENTAPSPAHACARPRIPVNVQAFIGGELFTGTHQDAQGAVRDTAVASLPLYAVRARYKRYELLFQDVPAAGPIRGVARVPRIPYDVKAGYGAVALRYWPGSGRFGFGIGDSLYVSQLRLRTHEHIAIRAAGLRYEVMRQFVLNRQNRMLLDLAVSPSMHQRSSAWLDGLNGASFPVFGTGSLVDAALLFETARGAGHTWVYGVRYLNYAGGNHYRTDWLKERTGVLAGFAAWGFTVGR